jgi:hypothetical protein
MIVYKNTIDMKAQKEYPVIQEATEPRMETSAAPLLFFYFPVSEKPGRFPGRKGKGWNYEQRAFL